jgi:hypothetical protein
MTCLAISVYVSLFVVIHFAYAQHSADSHIRKQITIGDIVISNFTASRAVQGEGGFHITGAGTTATVPDTQSHSTLILHADQIDGTPEGQDSAGILELSGHITYTITQTQNAERRRITGTAGHIRMRRSEGRVRLTETVHATITDSSTLSEPAVVSSESATIDLKAQPYRLTADGSDQLADVVFMPKSKSARDAGDRVHITKFVHGEFQPGVAADFAGLKVHADVVSSASGDHIELISSSIVSVFDHTILTEIHSGVPVTYHAEQRLVSGAVAQSVDGSARLAALHVADKLLELTGSSEARIHDSTRLEGTGTLVSGLTRLDLSARPYKFTADGPADTNSFQLPLSASAGSKQGPTTVHIYGYLHMVRAGEQTVDFTGPYTTIDISRQSPRSKSHILCSKLTIRMAPGNQSIERVTAVDHVRYTLVSAVTASVDRKLTGTAESAEVTFPPPVPGVSARDAGQKMTLHTVNCKLISPDWLTGEATLLGDEVDQVTEAGQTSVTVTGDPTVTDLFAPMRSNSSTAPGTPASTNAVHLSKFQRAQLNRDGSMSESGPHCLLEMNESPTKRASHIQADRIDISVDQVTKSPLVATAQGRVSMMREETVETKQTKAVTVSSRRLEASCARADYDVPKKRASMAGGVIGRIVDGSMLAEPCDFRADTAVATLNEPFSTLVLSNGTGVSTITDVRLGLIQKPALPISTQPAKLPKKPLKQQAAPFTRLHLYGFKYGEFEIGVGGSAVGVGTKLDADRSDGRKRVSLSAHRLTVRLAADGQELESAAADEDVVFDGKSIADTDVQSVHGTASNATYLGNVDQIRARGKVDAVITDPLKFASPGLLRTETLTVDIGQPQYVYTCSGDPTVNDIDFTLIQHDVSTPAAAQVPNHAGQSTASPKLLRVHAYSFSNGALQAGSAVTLTGDEAHLDMVRSDPDQKSKSSDSKITAPRLSAVFSEGGSSLSAARAQDGVQFAFKMPTASGLAEQSYTGHAVSLDYKLSSNVADAQVHQDIDMMGYLSVTIVNPEELVEPGLFEGLEGRALHMSFTNGEPKYSYDVGANPITMLLRPKQRLPSPGPTGAQVITPSVREKAP